VLDRTLRLADRERHEVLVEGKVAGSHGPPAKHADYRYGCAGRIVTLVMQLPATQISRPSWR
jgi:hypothetical protein